MPLLTPRFGAHLSTAGGLANAFAAGVAVGCDCLQLFVRGHLRWVSPPLADDQVTAFRAARGETGLNPVVAHAGYLINLASPSPATQRIASRRMAALTSTVMPLSVRRRSISTGSVQ